ncbi:MAG: hypothetical protein ACR2RL_02685 [Gammaproteobacteria bacterium]
MTNFLTRTFAIIALAVGAASFQSALANGYGTRVYINGVELTPHALMQLQYSLGGPVPPGDYRVDPGSGCWIELRTRRVGCVGRPRSMGDTPSVLGDRAGPITRYDLIK